MFTPVHMHVHSSPVHTSPHTYMYSEITVYVRFPLLHVAQQRMLAPSFSAQVVACFSQCTAFSCTILDSLATVVTL